MDKKDQIIAELRSKNQKLRKENAKLKKFAERDFLTGVFNRWGLSKSFSRIVKIFRRKAKDGIPAFLSLVYLDLVDFGAINKAEGQVAGDRALVAFAKYLEKGVRPQDMVVRMGGDEFVLLLVDIDEASTEKVVQRILFSSPQPFRYKVAVWEKGESLKDLLNKADPKKSQN